MKIKPLIDFLNKCKSKTIKYKPKRMKNNAHYSSKKFNKVYLLYKIILKKIK
jgi:hypothetical protein